MGAEIFYRLSNKWFYETVRPSYKALVDSYSAISKVKYPGCDHIVSKYRVASNPAYHAKPTYQSLGIYKPVPSLSCHAKTGYQSLGGVRYY